MSAILEAPLFSFIFLPTNHIHQPSIHTSHLSAFSPFKYMYTHACTVQSKMNAFEHFSLLSFRSTDFLIFSACFFFPQTRRFGGHYQSLPCAGNLLKWNECFTLKQKLRRTLSMLWCIFVDVSTWCCAWVWCLDVKTHHTPQKVFFTANINWHNFLWSRG